LPSTAEKQRRINRMRDTIRHFTARPLTPDERALLTEWLAMAGDIASAYIVQRRSDDPDLVNRIIVVESTDDTPSYIVHAASGRDIWFLANSGQRTKIRRFRTLRAALNSIRPLLADAPRCRDGKNNRNLGT
jgi:hypothetical protein